MEQKTLSVDIRDTLKKGAAGRLRRDGKIPAIVYGHGEPTPVAVDAHEFLKKFRTVSENTIIKLTSKQKEFDVLVKDYQADIVTGKVSHIDFYEVEKGKLLKTHVPLHISGNAIGVREGGILEHMQHEVEVECVPKDLPDAIIVDISKLKVGSSVHVGDITPPAGVKILNNPDQAVVTITVARTTAAAAEEEEETAAAEPTVSGE